MSDGFYRPGEWELGKIIDGRREKSDRIVHENRNHPPRNEDRPKSDEEVTEKEER